MFGFVVERLPLVRELRRRLASAEDRNKQLEKNQEGKAGMLRLTDELLGAERLRAALLDERLIGAEAAFTARLRVAVGFAADVDAETERLKPLPMETLKIFQNDALGLLSKQGEELEAKR
jgi:hypothetical protein